MKFKNFSLHAIPYIIEATCECGGDLIEVSNGLFSRAMFCPRCESVYELELIKSTPDRVSQEFLNQAREEAQKSVKYFHR